MTSTHELIEFSSKLNSHPDKIDELKTRIFYIKLHVKRTWKNINDPNKLKTRINADELIVCRFVAQTSHSMQTTILNKCTTDKK